MRPVQPRQDHLFHLERDDRGGILAFGDPGDLHQQRHADVGARDAPQCRHAAVMDALADRKTIDDRSRLDRRPGHGSSPGREAIGKRARQAVFPDPLRREIGRASCRERG
jgi:hypothetical protein